MNFVNHFILTLVSAISAVTYVNEVHLFKGTPWIIVKDWSPSTNSYEFAVKLPNVSTVCNRPTDFLNFPMMVLATQRFSLDGRDIMVVGDPENQSLRSFFGMPSIRCSILMQGKQLVWHVDSYTKYFANIKALPFTSTYLPLNNFFSENLNAIAAGALLVLALFNFIIFWKKAPDELTISILLSCILMSGYFLFTVPGLFNISVKSIISQKLADTMLWLGIMNIYKTFHLEGYLQLLVYRAVKLVCLASVSLILISSNSDVVQFGSLFPMWFCIFFAFFIIEKFWEHWKVSPVSINDIFQFGSYLLFLTTGFNDVLNMFGFINGKMLFSVGYLGGLTFLSLSVNKKIIDAYKERDYLRMNLEKEVDKKTAELNSRSIQLQSAMSNLQQAQAELVQSAKLASLGTLAAGVAHEINNSINYVNGALGPLQKILDHKIAEPESRAKVKKLTDIMKDGLDLTVEIIKSLRSYTGLNQAKFDEVKLKDVIDSVCTILRTKIRGRIDMQIAVADNIRIFGSIVGLNQVIMNLISNAIDSMPDGGEIEVTAFKIGPMVQIAINDEGQGISNDILPRIFDPFFTTKDVGKGTGLGLYIVQQEVKRHKGRMEVDSALGRGTRFTIWLPAFDQKATGAA